MSSSWPSPGVGHVGEYQRSGTPFVTSSNSTEVNSSNAIKIEFPRVTRWVEVQVFAKGSSNYLKIGFTENGIEGRGAVTGSIPTATYDTEGNPAYVTTNPAPNAYEQSATARNWFTMAASVGNTTNRLEIACKELFIKTDTSNAGVSVIAGLTNIHRDQFTLTGSSGQYGVG